MAMNTRRRLLQAIAGLVGASVSRTWAADEQTLNRNRDGFLRALFTSFDNSDAEITLAPPVGDASCILTQEQTEGPFFLTAPLRRDITEGKPGLPLDLAIQIVAADGCTPVAGVLVEVWHCDASGQYSGHPDTSRSIYSTLEYLQWDGGARRVPAINEDLWFRGAQQTNNDGIVQFKTIFPGWYDMRAPHIHFKIGGQNRELFTSQFYFDEATASRIYRRHSDYSAYGESPYSVANDMVVQNSGGAKGLLLATAAVEAGMEASARVGINLPPG